MFNKPQLNTTARITGLSAELHVRAELTYLGFSVFVTDHPYTRADLVVEMGECLVRIQVKTMVWRRRDSHYRVHPEDARRSPYGGKIDFFVFYAREDNEYFVVPYVEAANIGEITWRPAYIDKRKGGRQPKFESEKYRNAWDFLYAFAGQKPTDWQRERLQRWRMRRTCHTLSPSNMRYPKAILASKVSARELLGFPPRTGRRK